MIIQVGSAISEPLHCQRSGLTLLKLASYQAHSPTGLSSTSTPNNRAQKRNSAAAGLDSSPDSPESPDQHAFDHNSRKKAVKRACNECRQQKLRCDVVQDPFKNCTRCNRLRLECKIEDNFKRVGKRSRNAEMEREIVELRRQVAAQQTGLSLAQNSSYNHEAVAGLLDLRNSPGQKGPFKRLEDVTVTLDRVDELYKRFFTFNHPFLPFLNTERTPDEYYARSPLLFWTILIIGARHYTREPGLFLALTGPVSRLLWSTLAEVPQNYHVIKALILLCAWPLPTSSTSTDSTFMLSGLMMQISLQMGLHRPDHLQDFSKFRVELRQAELQDRVVVWAVCNVVAQRIATAYGQPAVTMYDWTLGPKPNESNANYELPELLRNRLLIEKFVDKVSRTVYSNDNDPVGLPDDETRAQLVKILSKELEELEDKLRDDVSPVTNIYLKAAGLNLHLSIFFSHQDIPSYRFDMLKLYNATTSFLEACLSLESTTSINLPSNYSHNLSLSHGTNYIFHMMLAAGFSLLKLMHYFLAQHELDTQGAQELFTRTIWALRSTSVMENDLAERLAEVLAQVWKSGPGQTSARENGTAEDDDEGGPLQLKVKCRRSMSLVFDSVWRWRKNFRDQRPPGGKLTGTITPDAEDELSAAARFFNQSIDDARPTPIEATAGIPSSNTTNGNGSLLNPDPSLTPSGGPIVPGMAGMPTGMVEDFGTATGGTTGPNGNSIGALNPSPDYSSSNYEVFDPLNWMLDGLVDFPYNFSSVPALDPSTSSSVNGIGVMSGDGL